MKGSAAALAIGIAFAHVNAAHGAGNPARGEELHRACLGCHGTELYEPGRAKIKTSAALRKEVVRWNDRMNPKFTKPEIDDLVAYLERDFYRSSR